jgi:hypothetical protein
MENVKGDIYTLVTGASQGIGRAISMECARRGMNLFLVALPNPLLEAVSTEIREKYKVRVCSLGIDLTQEDSAASVFEFARKNKIRINILVNNAGFGIGGLFANSPLNLDYRMIKLNNMAMIGLIHHFLPVLKSFDRSYIMNISSMEAKLPSPYKTVYTGTKNFIYAYSIALNEELRSDRVNVSVVCPGPVITNEDGYQRFIAQGAKAKLIMKTPEEVASIAVRGMLKSKTVIIPGFMPWLIMKLTNFIPELLKIRMLEKLFRVYKNMPINHTY